LQQWAQHQAELDPLGPENHRVRSPACPPEIVAECAEFRVPPSLWRPSIRSPVVALVRHLLATVMHTKFGEHQLLNCQSERFGREGIDLSIQKVAVQLPQDGVRIPLVLHDARSAPIFSAPLSAQVIEQALARGRAPVGREREGAVIQALKHGHSSCGMESPIACSTPAINPPGHRETAAW
jgi:hypothetical protein